MGKPPKQSHAVRNILLIILALMVLTCGGCLFVAGSFFNEVDKAVDKSIEDDKKPGGPDNPMTIQPGQAFEVDGFKYASGWKVGKDFGGDIDITKLKVTNDRGEKDSALVEIKFWKGTEVLGLADCTTEPIDPGSTVTLSCGSFDQLPKSYDKITINDTF